MDYNSTFLLTKSFYYNGEFDTFNLEILTSLKSLKSERVISIKNLVGLFKNKHSGDEVVLNVTNDFVLNFDSRRTDFSKYNFVIYSFDKNLFKHHVSQQIKKKIKTLEEEYMSQYSVIKEQYSNGQFGSKYIKQVVKTIIRIYEEILTSCTNDKKKEEKLKKYNEILKLLTYISNESDRKEIDESSILRDFIKVLRRYIDYMNLDGNSATLNKLKDLYIIVGRNNVVNISFAGTKDISITEGTRDSDDFIARAYKDSSGINSVLDNLSLLFDIVDINLLVNCKKNDLEIQQTETNIKRVIFSKCLFNERFFKKIWDGRNPNDIKREIDNGKYYYSLMGMNTAFYKELPFTVLMDIVRDQIDLKYYSLRDCEFIKNHNSGAYDNFFISDNSFVITESAQTNIEARVFNNTYPNDYTYKEWFLFKVADNHKIRFSAFIDAEIIFTSVVYSSMCVFAHRNFRNKIISFNKTNNHIVRMLQSHAISREYSKMNTCYSTHGPFIKNEKNHKAQIVFEHMGLRSLEIETDSLLRNVWQESNITNGKFFPFIQAFAAIVATVCAMISITSDATGYKIVFSIIAAITIIIEIIVSLVFIIKGQNKIK